MWGVLSQIQDLQKRVEGAFEDAVKFDLEQEETEQQGVAKAAASSVEGSTADLAAPLVPVESEKGIASSAAQDPFVDLIGFGGGDDAAAGQGDAAPPQPGATPPQLMDALDPLQLGLGLKEELPSAFGSTGTALCYANDAVPLQVTAPDQDGGVKAPVDPSIELGEAQPEPSQTAALPTAPSDVDAVPATAVSAPPALSSVAEATPAAAGHAAAALLEPLATAAAEAPPPATEVLPTAVAVAVPPPATVPAEAPASEAGGGGGGRGGAGAPRNEDLQALVLRMKAAGPEERRELLRSLDPATRRALTQRVAAVMHRRTEEVPIADSGHAGQKKPVAAPHPAAPAVAAAAEAAAPPTTAEAVAPAAAEANAGDGIASAGAATLGGTAIGGAGADTTPSTEPGDAGPEAVGSNIGATLGSATAGCSGNMEEGLPGSPSAATKDEVLDYRSLLVELYTACNPEKLEKLDELLAKFKGRKRELYVTACRKYQVQPKLPSSELAAAAGSPVAASLSVASLASGEATSLLSAAATSWFQPPAALGATLTGNISAGLKTLQSLHENVERSFETALRSQEDTSAADLLKQAWKPVEVLEVPAQRRTTWEEEGDLPDDDGNAPDEGGECDTAMEEDEEEEEKVEVPKEADSPVSLQEVTDSGVTPPAAAAVAAADPKVVQELEALRSERKRLRRQLESVRADRQNVGKELEVLRSEKAKLQRECDASQEERSGLKEEGMRMSKRIHDVENKLKEVMAESRHTEQRCLELDRTKASLHAQVSKLTARAEEAEQAANEQRAEARRVGGELERARKLLQGEQQRLEAEKQVQQQNTKRRSERERQLEEKLEAAMRARDELLATNSSLSAELEQALATIDLREEAYQEQLGEALHANEAQRQRLERVELEFAQQSLPSTQHVADLEARLSRYEAVCREREREAAQRVEAAEGEKEKLARETDERIAELKRQVHELREEVGRGRTAAAEKQEVTREASELRFALESADHAKEAAEGELRLERSLRSAEAKRMASLEEQVADLTKRLGQARAASAVVAGVIDAPSEGPGREQNTEVARRLRLEVEALQRQRNELQREATRLQGVIGGQHGSAQLVTKFEAALQAIGRLQEEMEVCQYQRDQYKAQCARLTTQLAGAGAPT